MIMGRWIGLCLMLSFTGNIAYAISALPVYSVFYLPAGEKKTLQPYLELYWQIDPSTVQFAKNEAGVWLGKIKTTIDIIHDTGVIASEKILPPDHPRCLIAGCTAAKHHGFAPLYNTWG